VTRAEVQNAPTPTVQSAPHVLYPAGAQNANVDLRAHILQELNRFHRLNHAHADSSDRKRLTALEQAVKQMDWDYLMTHLFYCVLSLDKAALPDRIKSNMNATKTERFLSEVLDVNHSLTPATQAFFVQFPISLQQWATLNPSQHRIDVENFNDLMNRSARYFELKEQCNERNLPPSIHELTDDLGIRSRQLQSIVFTAAVRRLWFKSGLPPGDILNQYEQEALRYFSLTQETFYNRRHQVPELGRPQERELEMDSWRRIFKNLRSKYVPTPSDAPTTMHALHQVPVLASNDLPTTHLRPQQPHRVPSGHDHHPPLVEPFVHFDPRMPLRSAQTALPLGLVQTRERPRPVTQQPRPQPQRQAQSQLHPFQQSILPAVGHQQSQQRTPNPARFALHQAHLMGPDLHSKTGERLYQFVQAFLRKPQRLVDARNRIERWTFTLSPQQMAMIPKNNTDKVGGPPILVVDENNLMLRLRCVKWNSSQTFDEHRWATSDTSWIPYSYLELNGKSLELRKKLHHGKDLPIDLTSLVKEGENVLEIALVRAKGNEQFRDYLLAIEVLRVKPHAALLEEILTKQHISAASTKQRIKDKLAGTADDEIAVVNSTLNITMFDPFSLSEMCSIPARSQVCEHFDCFDLETFLATRSRNADSTVPDNWKCPICNGDARPHHLIVDGFLQEVRSELEKQGLLKTRTIIMSEDGSWKPKPELTEGVADGNDDDDDAPANPNRQSVSRQQKTPVSHAMEVIDLGDSDVD
jgi:hypothetical protein